MKYLAIIQARSGSSRLPLKILKKFAGKPDLQWVIERVEKSRYVDEVMVATTINPEDIPVVSFVSSLGKRVFAGSSDDVLDRYYQAARLLKPEYVIRVTADCPMYDWELLDDAISKMDPEDDYSWAATETLADGLDIEVLKFECLEKAWKEAHLMSEREHVTLYLKNHPELFKTRNYECPLGNLNAERWTLDEERDYEFLSKVYDHFASVGKEFFTTAEICEFLSANPEVRGLNAGIIRNEGLQISLKNDHRVD